jgi:hypothetical protein
MIYEINTSDIPSALAAGALLIIISSDSQLALVQSESPIECLASYNASELNTLMNDIKWRQPCKDCEV